ncbi:unnamed protein product [Tetraodon nigroviridis]|uniref:(spotted green pufferfish) hypothetical protein n=1 Tax=Tetraodon nigroviridis TaxID=99883 RepID=Q4RZB8_TETNG|nr:unnamed protein product [Tetraodon nigroviridis]
MAGGRKDEPWSDAEDINGGEGAIERLLGDGRSQRSNSVSNQYFQAKLTLQITRDPVLDRSTGHGFSLTTNGPLLVRDVATGTAPCAVPRYHVHVVYFQVTTQLPERHNYLLEDFIRTY